MKENENLFVEQALKLVPSLVLPIGEAKKAVAGSLYRWLSYVWRQVSRIIVRFESVDLLTRLFRLPSSLSLTADPP
jgi:hypothetical protein